MVTYLAGFFVSWVLRHMTDKYEFPTEDEHTGGWAKVISNVDELTEGGRVAGRWIGWLERMFYVAAFWHSAATLILGWLAVKVATIWQAWSGLMNVLKIKSEDVLHPPIEIATQSRHSIKPHRK